MLSYITQIVGYCAIPRYTIASCISVYTQHCFHANDTCLERVAKNIRYIMVISLRNGRRKQKNGKVQSRSSWRSVTQCILTLDV